jgi:hypothetical protein
MPIRPYYCELIQTGSQFLTTEPLALIKSYNNGRKKTFYISLQKHIISHKKENVAQCRHRFCKPVIQIFQPLD